MDDTLHTIGASPSSYEASDGGMVLGSTKLLPGFHTTHSGHVISVGSGRVVVELTGELYQVITDLVRSCNTGIISLSDHCVSKGANALFDLNKQRNETVKRDLFRGGMGAGARKVPWQLSANDISYFSKFHFSIRTSNPFCLETAQVLILHSFSGSTIVIYDRRRVGQCHLT